jgi:Domain of unknown function (DUF3332)
MMMKRRSLARGVMISFVLISFFASITACYGPFNMTRNVYHWNSGIKGSGEVNEKWMKEIVFFGMIIIPVYMFSALLDAFVFNAIQFWSGDNPIKLTQGPDGHIQEVQLRDQTIHVTWSEDHRSAALTYRQQGRAMRTALIVEDGHGYRLLEGGQILFLTEQAIDGGVNFVDGDCRLVDHVSFERLWQASNDLARPSS